MGKKRNTRGKVRLGVMVGSRGWEKRVKGVSREKELQMLIKSQKLDDSNSVRRKSKDWY